MQIPRTIVFGIAIASACVGFNMNAGDHEVNWETGVTGAAGNNDFAPYYIASNRHGVITQANLPLCVDIFGMTWILPPVSAMDMVLI